jgi:hypothetical protein
MRQNGHKALWRQEIEQTKKKVEASASLGPPWELLSPGFPGKTASQVGVDARRKGLILAATAPRARPNA